jgi:ribosomal-protein-alanine N-acetyltransferase
MIDISLCKKNDNNNLFEIKKSTFQDNSFKNQLKILEKQTSNVIWKIKEKKIIGFVSFFHVEDEIEIIKISILKSYQRKNYGSILINEIKKLKIKKIFLEVSVENINAINFYLKNGFQQIGIRKGYYTNNKNLRIDAIRFCFKR